MDASEKTPEQQAVNAEIDRLDPDPMICDFLPPAEPVQEATAHSGIHPDDAVPDKQAAQIMD